MQSFYSEKCGSKRPVTGTGAIDQELGVDVQEDAAVFDAWLVWATSPRSDSGAGQKRLR